MKTQYFYDKKRKQVIAVQDSGPEDFVRAYVLVPLELERTKEEEDRDK